MSDEKQAVPPEVEAAIRSFLEECQREASPFDLSQAVEAVRRIFPGLDVSDDALIDALRGEAAATRFEVAEAEISNPPLK